MLLKLATLLLKKRKKLASFGVHACSDFFLVWDYLPSPLFGRTFSQHIRPS